MHIKYGGRMVEYAGFELPVQYTGIAAEHLAVRNTAGLFDVSHMGEFMLTGADALANIQNLFVNDFTNMVDSQVRYSPMCNDSGGIVDDLLVYKNSDGNYMIVVNAANIEKDFAWIKSKLYGNVDFNDVSALFSQIAVQGPKAADIIESICDSKYIPAKKYHFCSDAVVGGIECILSTTGYTGESGFELYVSNENAVSLWEALIEAGKPFSLVPCGLGARDTLRLEAAMPLYGHEMSDEITPLETGLAFFTKMNKESFIGKEALIKKGEPSVCRVGLIINGKGIARGGESVFAADEKIGFITSGTANPVNKLSIAMAIIDKNQSGEGKCLQVEIRDKKMEATVVKLPFLTK